MGSIPGRLDPPIPPVVMTFGTYTTSGSHGPVFRPPTALELGSAVFWLNRPSAELPLIGPYGRRPVRIGRADLTSPAGSQREQRGHHCRTAGPARARMAIGADRTNPVPAPRPAHCLWRDATQRTINGRQPGSRRREPICNRLPPAAIGGVNRRRPPRRDL